MRSLALYQELKLIIPKCLLKAVHLSFPKWSDMVACHSKGFVRDPQRAAPSKKLPYRDYDPSFLLPYDEHFRLLNIPADTPLLAIGNGNLGNNLRFIAYSQVQGLFALPGEDTIDSNREYACLFVDPEGQLVIEKQIFPKGKPKSDLGINWATSGQPIVWDSDVVPIYENITEFYDLRHVFHLPTEAQIDEATKRVARKQLDELMAVYMDVFPLQHQEANARLIRKVMELNLKREPNYLHSAIGMNAESVFVVQRHGLVEDIARTLVNLRAERALLLDQGGSVGTYFRSNPRLEGEFLPGSFIFTSHYFRNRRLSIIVFVLAKGNVSEASCLSSC
jgi:hypothetical protein